ncbi:creatininase family protein [Oryzomonas japonica]|uniref:Creatininase family protein n=1 Tax=Oryzomonas japonica TaxID=2603858 RepID=A0A7J4ZTU0_9BACT|nr:creatininase family protein [Oryzomonas japonica]KAB0666625.1 creatininase family protein [Oryzomonas japonica]
MIIEEMTMTEFEAGLAQTRTVLIPFGSVEEHGSHLPLSTDTLEAYEVCKKASLITPLFVAPPVHYGNCRSTARHPGTISISTQTLGALFQDIVIALRGQGLRSFVALTGHAGGAHRMALQDAGEALIARFADITVAVVSEFDLAQDEGRDIIETPGDSHAGEIETSRILHTHPHLVKGRAPREFPHFPNGMLVRDKRRYWPGGVWGDPGKASAEKGARLENLLVRKLVELVREMEKGCDE